MRNRLFSFRFVRVSAWILLITMLQEIFMPLTAYAVTGGPSQPEVESFEPAGTTQMVDLFSGDFNYNIPLLSVGNYPINLAYHGGIGMEQEATWVGLGWNINVGAINRQKRGIPDDFNQNDQIVNRTSMRPNRTVSMNLGKLFKKQREFIGFELNNLVKKIHPALKLPTPTYYYNNYKGLGISYSLLKFEKGPFEVAVGYDNQSGMSISPSLSFSKTLKSKREVAEGKAKNPITLLGSVGASYNSRSGLQQLSFGHLMAQEKKKGVLRKIVGKLGSFANGSVISFANPTSTPSVSPNMFSGSYDLSLSFGRELKFKYAGRTVGASFSVQGIAQTEKTYRPIGYLYAEDQGKYEDAIYDVNRENDQGINRYTQLTSLPNHTYDIYSVSGQGVGGMFRPMRNSVGVLTDANRRISERPINGAELGAEIGVGETGDLKIGADIAVNFNYGQSGAWDSKDFDPENVLKFNEWSTSFPTQEPVYFKRAGELTQVDEDYYGLMGNDHPVRLELAENFERHNLKFTNLINKYVWNSSINKQEAIQAVDLGSDVLERDKRDKRSSPYMHLTAEDAENHGLQKDILSYVSVNPDLFSSNVDGQFTYIDEAIAIPRNGGIRKPNHISEITSTNVDGTRYVYGIPAYNVVSKDVSFNVSTNTVNSTQGTVQYTSGVDNSVDNEKGRNHMFSSEEISAYAHSYLLTAVLANNYIDRSGDGPSLDDIGDYTKINYTQVFDDYKWRIPYEDANFNEAYLSDDKDDMASYSYGEKEVWYMHSIESKTHKAFFYISDRDDGLEVNDEDGGQGSRHLQKLDKIELYTLNELKLAEIEGRKPVPIKSVHFEYESTLANQLCKNIPNTSVTGGGKLTLKRVWFTYGTSLKGQLSPYEFEYNSTLNYNYHQKGFDRWGNYMPGSYHGFPNSERPYTVQEETEVDNWAAAWSITKITLPSGGAINVEYESDDYAYVQDRKAMQMIDVIGFGPTNDPAGATNNLFERKTLAKDIINGYVFFNLPNSSSTSIKDYCPDDMEYVYLNTKIDLTRSGDYEYVGGYYELDHQNKGIAAGNIGYIKLREADLNDNMKSGAEAHPVSKRAWQFARINRSGLVYPGSNSMDADAPVLEIAKAMVGSVNEIYKMVTGFNRALRDKRYGQTVDLTHTWVRLNNNTGFKKGGGHRVKKIYIEDNMEGTKVYGQEYDYTMWDENSGQVISSGVAAYEPMIGGDENPFREMLHSYAIKNKLAPNDFMFDEGPIGESFFPGPSVGYRKVTVKSLADPTTKRHATGKTVSEFYTAYDFPVITNYTPIQSDFSPKFKLSGFVGFTRDFATASQGFSIELNDMHGKPKAEWVYAEKTNNSPSAEESPISGVKYVYYTDADNSKHLSNTVKVMQRDGTMTTEELGKDVDLTVDARQSQVYSGHAGGQFNLDLANLGLLPVPTFTVLPDASLNYSRTRIVSTTKVVQRYGIIQKVIAYKNGASLTTENLAFDSETGDILLSKTQNEYDNYNYSTKIPAHWVASNEGMGPAYQNLNSYVSLNLGTDGKAQVTSADLVPGDELIQVNGDQRIWVLSLDGSGGVHCIDRFGQNATSTSAQTYRIVRSGRRNLIGATAATYTHQDDQLVSTNNRYYPSGNTNWSKVVAASSAEYRDEWQTPYPTQGGCYRKYKFDLWVKYYHQMINNLIQSGIISGLDETGCSGYDQTVTLYEDGKYYYGYNPYMLKVHQSSASQTINKVVLGLNLKTSPASNNLYRQSSLDYVAVEGVTGSIELYNNPSGSPIATNTRTFDISFPYDDHKNFMYYTPNYYSSATCNGCGVSSGYPGSDKSMHDLISPNETYPQSPTHITALDLFGKLTASCGTSGSNFNFPVYSAQNKSYQAYNDFMTVLEDPGQFLIHEHHETGSSTSNGHGNVSQNMPTYASDKATSSLSNYLTHQYKAFYNYGQDWVVITLVDYGGCFDCSSTKSVVNPYVEGTKGNWQVKTGYVYFDKGLTPDRTSSVSSPTGDKNEARMAEDGFLPTGFKLFYEPGASGWVADASASSKWTWAEQTTQMDPQGNVVETTNALGIYSSVLFSHSHNNVPMAVAGNAMRQEIAYTGFEDDNDIAYAEAWDCSSDRHLDFASLYTTGIEVSTDEAHTGISSLKIGAGKTGNVTTLLGVTKLRENVPTRTYGDSYTLEDYNKLQEFSLLKDKTYVISYWVKADNQDADIILKENGCDLGSGATLVSVTNLAENSIPIDGWIKVERSFHTSTTATDLCLEITNTSGSVGYIDDIRIFPMDGNLVSYVYHPYTLRLWAELDENNYATFYEYDQEGKLVRVKKETERGVQTIQENRSGLKKQ